MLEDQGKCVEAQAKAVADSKKRMSPGKLELIQTGKYVVYVLPDKAKEVTVGKVTAVSRSEQTIIVHRYKPITDNQLRLYWQPVYVEGGTEVLGSGSVPSTETVSIKRLLFPVQLHDRVLNHAAARRLDHSGYSYERGPICDLNGDPADKGGDPVDQGAQSSGPCLVPAAGAVLHIHE
jgi:hypothetical protein